MTPAVTIPANDFEVTQRRLAAALRLGVVGALMMAVGVTLALVYLFVDPFEYTSETLYIKLHALAADLGSALVGVGLAATVGASALR